MPDFTHENAAITEGFAIVCGVDEAGRGPWAGPVVAAAAILDLDHLSTELRSGIDDSKKLNPAARETLFDLIDGAARTGVGVASVEEIDSLNVLEATMTAMARAVADLGAPPPDLALIDGNRTPSLVCPARAIVRGDALSLSIAAASIIAKVSRDRMMVALDARYPGYGWARNAGYGTAEHQAALAALGVTPAHRRSFRPIRKILGNEA